MTVKTLIYSFPNFEPVCCSMSGSNCHFLTYLQVSQETGKVVWYSQVWYSNLFFPQFVVIHTVKDFSLVSEAEVDIFLEFSWFFCDPTDVHNLVSGSSAFSKSSLNIWKFLVHLLLKFRLKDFEHYLAIMWNECNYMVVWTLWHCLSLGLEWKLSFSSPVITDEFSKFAGILSVAL